MEKERLEDKLKELGIKFFWIKEDILIDKILEFLRDKKFYVSSNLNLIKSNADIKEADFGIFEGKLLIEETGTLLVSSEELSSLIPPISLAIVKRENIKEKYEELIDFIKNNKGKSFCAITGSSRTADIEKIIVIPAHGPKDLILFII